jgi:hypothetical protein
MGGNFFQQTNLYTIAKIKTFYGRMSVSESSACYAWNASPISAHTAAWKAYNQANLANCWDR